jgi:LytS/YehU family sensor histidine kinase
MNAVQHLILDHQETKAVTYLNKFSRLMRQVLDSSEYSYISLQSEIEILENYILIENLRLDDKFDHEIKLITDISADELMIPQMIVQPFIENAILHGLKPLSARRGLLTVNFEMKSENQLVCVITDNGIGRIVASANKPTKSHESKAIRLTEERLKLLGIDIDHPVTIDDLDNPTGTRVTIHIPVTHEF